MKQIFERLGAVIGAIAGAGTATAAQDNPGQVKADLDRGLIGNLGSIIKPLFSGEVPRFFAGHRSHSSHASHGSHRSSAGGGYVAPSPTPAPPRPSPPRPPAPPAPSYSDPLGQPPKPSATFKPATPDVPKLANDSVKRENVIKRIQLALRLQNAYSGPIDGVMDAQTRDAIDLYKIKKGVPRGGYLDAATLKLFDINID